MIIFKASLEKFAEKGEKTGWTYVTIPGEIAEKIKPDNKKSFRVKGKLDEFDIKAAAVLPMGDGDFILPVNAVMRKGIKKIHGASVQLRLEEDKALLKISADLATCFKDEPDALNYFEKLPPSHRNWYSNWVKGAKTDSTKSKRIAAVVKACSLRMTFGEMMRSYRDERKLRG